MYGNGWRDNRDGTFTSTSMQSGFSPLDLYLMGMIPKEQVPPMLLIDNPAIDGTQLPHLGDTVTGTAKMISIDDIIAAEGVRAPDANVSPKKFRVGFVLLTRPGTSAGNAPAAVETIRSAWAGRFAELTGGKGSVADVAPTLTLQIDSPADGATIVGPDVTVTGTVINSTGAETGVVVNGIPATVSGSRFVVNHVPLQLGTNTITVTSTDTSGQTTTATATVAAAPGHYMRLTSNIESGVAPLDLSLRLNGSFSISNPSLSFAGPMLVQLAVGRNANEYTAKLAVEGTYTITATATGPDEQTYSDTVTITVQSKTRLDNLLKAKWDGMKAAVLTGNTAAALAYFVPGAQDRFNAIFTDPTSEIAARLSEVNRVEVFTVKGHAAQAGAVKMETGIEYAYPLNFVKDLTGIWLIHTF